MQCTSVHQHLLQQAFLRHAARAVWHVTSSCIAWSFHVYIATGQRPRLDAGHLAEMAHRAPASRLASAALPGQLPSAGFLACSRALLCTLLCRQHALYASATHSTCL